MKDPSDCLNHVNICYLSLTLRAWHIQKLTHPASADSVRATKTQQRKRK